MSPAASSQSLPARDQRSSWRACWGKITAAFRTYRGSAALLLLFVAALTSALWNGEMTLGDTSSYFAHAVTWARKRHFSSPGVMVLSPLYVVFYAWVQRWFFDAAAATAVHHLLITIGIALTLLAAARSILPKAWAWLVAAWWLALHWNDPYEVHQFGFALLLLGAALAGGGRSPWWRGAALAVLLVDAVFVRNELLLAVGCFALAVGWEVLRAPVDAAHRRKWLAPALPSVIAGVLMAALFSGDSDQLKLSRFRAGFEGRNRVNFRQVYPFSYLQRRTDWHGDPWIGGGELMQRDFGQPQPTMREAFFANPRAVLEHVAWNLRLLPAGLQFGLFGCYSSASPPDYAGARPAGMRDPFWLSLLLAALLGAGAFLGRRHWPRLRRRMLRLSAGTWVWVYLASTIPTSLVAIATQRPRPSYIFPLLLLAMLFTAWTARLLLKAAQRQWSLPATAPRWTPVLLSVVFVGLVTPAGPVRRSSHPLTDDYHRLSALRFTLGRDHRTLCANTDRLTSLGNYLHNGRKDRWSLRPWSTLGTLPDSSALQSALEREGVTDLYLTDTGLPLFGQKTPLPHLQFVGDWQEIAWINDPSGRWGYWARPDLPSRKLK